MIDIDPVKARVAAATSGPWFAHVDDLIGGWCIRTVDTQPSEGPGEVASFIREEDATLIAHARSDMESLVTEIERLRTINDEYLLEMGRQHAKLREQAREKELIQVEAERHRRIADEAVTRIESAEKERTAVVAWLREWQGTMDDRITHDDVDYAILVVERGEHHQREP